MEIQIKRLTVHAPIFLGGSNCSEKLDVEKRAGMTIVFRPDERIYIVTYKGCAIMIHDAAAVYSEPMNIKDLGLELKEAPPAKVVPVKHHAMKKGIESAQVGDPTRGNIG